MGKGAGTWLRTIEDTWLRRRYTFALRQCVLTYFCFELLHSVSFLPQIFCTTRLLLLTPALLFLALRDLLCQLAIEVRQLLVILRFDLLSRRK